MRSCSVFVMAVLCLADLFVMRGDCRLSNEVEPRATNFKVSSFEWKNCGKPDAPVSLASLEVSPDPIVLPGTVRAGVSGTTKVELAAPLAVNLTLEKEAFDFWVHIPCVDQMGSCHYPDGCAIVDMLIPPGQDCPEPFHTYGLPCHCPFAAGTYTLPQSEFVLPKVELPFWLTNGKYRVQATVGSQGKEIFCVKVTLALHSDGWL